MSSATTSAGLEQLDADQHHEIDQDQRWTGIAFEILGQYWRLREATQFPYDLLHARQGHVCER